MGSGLLGIIGVLVHHLLKQNAQRAEEHKEAMAAIAKLNDRVVELHLQAMAAVAALAERMAALEAKVG